MAAVLAANNVEEEYMWGCTLDKGTKEFSWSPAADSQEAGDDNLKPGHRLLIKNAILMPEAKKDEVTVVQIECEGYNKKKVVIPVVAMKGGVDHQRYVDLLVPSPAKLTLLSGEGPVHLVGSHCVDYYGYRDTGEEDEDAESSEDDEVDMEEQETAASREDTGSKKRKASDSASTENGKKKKTEDTKLPEGKMEKTTTPEKGSESKAVKKPSEEKKRKSK